MDPPLRRWAFVLACAYSALAVDAIRIDFDGAGADFMGTVVFDITALDALTGAQVVTRAARFLGVSVPQALAGHRGNITPLFILKRRCPYIGISTRLRGLFRPGAKQE